MIPEGLEVVSISDRASSFDKLVSFTWALCHPRNDAKEREAEGTRFNQLRWQLIADHNERPNRIQLFVVFFLNSSV